MDAVSKLEYELGISIRWFFGIVILCMLIYGGFMKDVAVETKHGTEIKISLFFPDPVFKEGINTTVVRGVPTVPMVDEMAWLKNEEGRALGYCKVLSVRNKRFCDITVGDLLNGHNEISRDLNSLYNYMLDVHEGFDNRELISIVDFEIVLMYEAP